MKKRNWEHSVVLSLVAVLISLASAGISLSETRILRKQQQIMQAQKNASVWPFVEMRSSFQFASSEREELVYTMSVMNNGIGPAIVGDVEYLLEGTAIETWQLEDSLRERFPQFSFNQTFNQNIDRKVIPRDTRLQVVSVEVKKRSGQAATFQEFIDNINFKLKFPYSSVYGDCWQRDGGSIEKLDDCEEENRLF